MSFNEYMIILGFSMLPVILIIKTIEVRREIRKLRNEKEILMKQLKQHQNDI